MVITKEKDAETSIMRESVAVTEEKPVLDRINQALLDQLAADGGPPIYTLTPEEARGVLLRAQSAFSRPDDAVKDWEVNWRKTTLRLRTIRPRSISGRPPVVIYFHGAGWVMGDSTTHDRLVRQLAAGADAMVVFVDYSRAPEHRYPVAIEEAYAATCYVSEHADDFGVDAARLAVAGDSVGGNMATVAALLAKQRSGPQILGQLLFYPVTNANFESGSYNQFADGPWLTKSAMQWFWDQYLPDHSMRKDPTASPLMASTEQLSGLPKALIITAENDVLRDEGEAYGRKLMEAGVETVTARYNGTIHDFVMLNALAEAATTRAAISQAVDFLKGIFGGTANLHVCVTG